jgi:drug/metabolite transporter (DMT)-like permease
MKPKTVLLIATSLACFAGNSLLCRLGLATGDVDAATFTGVRLASGALVLAVLARARRRPDAPPPRPGFGSAAALFAYAALFSYAYLRLGAALGALVLFGMVQMTMIGWGVRCGERPSPRAWLGIVVAIAGLVALTAPGKGAPEPLGTLAMACAGVAWGIYSLRGRGTKGDPVLATATNFARTLPAAALLVVTASLMTGLHATPRGLGLALASGALASGLGYSVWFAALPHITATRAAVLQLLVPILAALAAISWLGESPSLRLIVASATILGGVGLTISRPRPVR